MRSLGHVLVGPVSKSVWWSWWRLPSGLEDATEVARNLHSFQHVASSQRSTTKRLQRSCHWVGGMIIAVLGVKVHPSMNDHLTSACAPPWPHCNRDIEHVRLPAWPPSSPTRKSNKKLDASAGQRCRGQRRVAAAINVRLFDMRISALSHIHTHESFKCCECEFVCELFLLLIVLRVGVEKGAWGVG